MILTAERVKRLIWRNAETCSGDLLTIDRDYLAHLLHQLEREQYGAGFSDGQELIFRDQDGVEREVSEKYRGLW